MRKAFWDPFNIVLLLLSPREPHTQFASWMETKVVVATAWLPVGIGLNYPYFLTTMETSTPACTATHVRGTGGAATEVKKKALLITYKWSLWT